MPSRLQDRPTELLYDDSAIRVVWYPGNQDRSQYALITFGDLENLAEDRRFWAEAPVRKSLIPCLGVMAHTGNWFPRASMMAARKKFWSRIKAYRQRIAYGGSMGGYAAIKHSRLLAATQIVAFCPQWSIDPAECAGRATDWQRYFVPAMAGMGIRAGDVAGNVFVFADASDRVDRFHVEKIREACPSLRFVNVPSVGHHVTSVFAGTPNLLQLLDACRVDSMPRLTAISRALRKDHRLRRETLIERAIPKRPDLIFPIILKAVRNHEAWVLQRTDYLSRATDWLAGRGQDAQAEALRSDATTAAADPRSQFLACARLSRQAGSRIVLATSRESQVAYDLAADCCVHAGRPDGIRTIPVFLQIRGDAVGLCVDLCGARIDLRRDAHGLLRLCPGTESEPDAACFAMQQARPGWFSLLAAGRFLCADDHGRLVCDRPEADDWEHFRFGTASDDARTLGT